MKARERRPGKIIACRGITLKRNSVSVKHRYFLLLPNNPPMDSKDFWKIKAPDFDKDIWPYFIENAELIVNIFLNRCKGNSISRWDVKGLTEIVNISAGNFIQIDGLSRLEDKRVEILKRIARLGFALDLFYYTEDLKFVTGLLELFPWQGSFVDEEIPFLKYEDSIRLKHFTDKYKEKGFLIAYSAETNLLGIWGHEDSLSQI